MRWARSFYGVVTLAGLASACSSPETNRSGSTRDPGGADGAVADSAAPGGRGGAGGAQQAGAGGDAAGGGAGGRTPAAGGGNGVGGAPSQADVFARASVAIGSCIEDDGISRNNMYMWYAASIARVWGRFGSRAECLATHGNGCDAVTACAGWEWKASTEPCTDGCSGSAYTQCGTNLLARVDCSKLGLVCDLAAICAPSATSACDPATFADTCEGGTMPAFCDDGAVFRGPDCAALGLACSEGTCVGTGPACTGESATNLGDVAYHGVSCDGPTLVSCVGGREHRLECSGIAEGFSCQVHEGASFCGITNECTPAEPGAGSGPPATCDGTTVVFCNAGRVERVDCRALGFDGCDVTNGYGCVPGFLR